MCLFAQEVVARRKRKNNSERENIYQTLILRFIAFNKHIRCFIFPLCVVTLTAVKTRKTVETAEKNRPKKYTMHDNSNWFKVGWFTFEG